MFPHLLLVLIINGSLVLLCMVLHEFGHFLAARFYYVPVRKIGIGRMGMYIQRARTTGWPEVTICLAGVAMNLLLAIVFWNTNRWFGLCNLTFAWVNILPITHSDGSHAWEALRSMYTRASI
ncbi:MAG: site-2 protease family protein [Silvibacterium sp.]